MDDDEFPVSYEGVTPGVPVLTRDREEFGILEHVLEVPELDVFDGIVVWVGHGGVAQWRIQRELSAGHRTRARFLENITRSGDLRFVDADQVAAITAAYIRCDLDRSDVGRLPKPQGAPGLLRQRDRPGPAGDQELAERAVRERVRPGSLAAAVGDRAHLRTGTPGVRTVALFGVFWKA